MSSQDPKDNKDFKSTNDRLIEHSYDGIQEYDNPMPRWWLLTFAGTIIFSVIYVFNIGPVGNGKGRIADYEDDVKKFAAAHPAPTGEISGDKLLAMVKDKDALHEGEEEFKKYCASCHRMDAGGLIGPNLTDNAWIHGGRITDIYKTVTNGVLEKGMPAWGTMLKPEQVEQVVAYVASLQGSNPANPKAPQGPPVTP
ncbi:cbb3-type cytochrome c oxidase N-terminal domain-containing protein [Gemmatimonas groenlandica]|uniref:C-type cytochrome n=1 Tax=Gemmatimonas groenlandica TaxID=2732249 RepID=A0A6M4IVX5_9BACT|nr:cbb3-type cytochrome c oxidase N-terminal domain-containing protein [Gemmatimonas groenlandica]QJR37022.1 c-type cytochrome [Gemmatimonas groenlandica]